MKMRAKHLASKAALVFPLRSVDQAFVMALCLIFSIPVLFGKAPAPGSIEAAMPPVMVIGWAIVLAIGAGTILVSYFIGDRLLGIVVEQFGSVCLGVAALFYGGAIFAITYEQGGAIPESIILGFSAARFYQVYQDQKFLNQVQEVLIKVGEEKADGV